MNKIAEEKAFIAYPKFVVNGGSNYDHNTDRRYIFEQGYVQSAKDTIERIRAEIEKVIPKEIIFDDDEDYGRKDAFNYVLGVISTLEKEYE